MTQQQVQVPPRVATQPTMLAFGERVARIRDELASRFADPAAQEAMAYVQSSLREELETTRSVSQ